MKTCLFISFAIRPLLGGDPRGVRRYDAALSLGSLSAIVKNLKDDLSVDGAIISGTAYYE